MTEVVRPGVSDDLGFHQGVVQAVDPAAGTNTILVAGTLIQDVPLLTYFDAASLMIGDVVCMLSYRSSWFVLGKVQAGPVAFPSIRFYPDSGDNYSEISSRSDIFPGEATLLITTGVNAAETAASLVEIAAGFILAAIFDPTRSSYNGGKLELAESYATVGIDSPAGVQHWLFDVTNDWTKHIGSWPNFNTAGSTDGLFTGTVSDSGPVSAIIVGYGATMASQTVPVATFMAGGAVATTHTWRITAFGLTDFTLTWATLTSGRVDFWCFRT